MCLSKVFNGSESFEINACKWYLGSESCNRFLLSGKDVDLKLLHFQMIELAGAIVISLNPTNNPILMMNFGNHSNDLRT